MIRELANDFEVSLGFLLVATTLAGFIIGYIVMSSWHIVPELMT